jgi:xylan 1,4-beta-xylosidase
VEGALPPVWRFFGADEPNYATMKNGQKLIGELGSLRPKEVYFRAHNLLTSGDGTPALKWGSTGVYDEDPPGNPIYNWTIIDNIFDTYLEKAVRPYVEIGFMPKTLSTQPEPYQHHWTPQAAYDEIYTGWAYPPKDYKKWGDLVFEWTRHCVERYRRAEVETWYFEVWNEANIGYWRGSPSEFAKLHDYAIAGVKRALPTARVGGPDCAGSGGKWMRDFLDHCLRGTNYATGQLGTPIDFISSHAKGAPTYERDGHVRMGIANHLRDIDGVFRIVASYPELQSKPIIIGESDPEGCAACQGPQLAYRNGTMYPTYTAACLARAYDLAQVHGVNFEGALTWAFEFEDQPYFAGFRTLASNGIDKPVLNVFRMFRQMGERRLAAKSDHAVALSTMLNRGVRDKPDIAALASLSRNQVCVMVWHYHDDDLPGPAAAVSLDIEGFPAGIKQARLEHFRIDDEHSNGYTAWKRLGSPQQPTAAQYAQLQKEAQLAALEPKRTLAVADGKVSVIFRLPRLAVSLLKLTW